MGWVTAPFVPPHQLAAQERLASQLPWILAVGAQVLQGWAGERRQGLMGGGKPGSLFMMAGPRGGTGSWHHQIRRQTEGRDEAGWRDRH